MSRRDHISQAEATVLFDGQCGFCGFSVDLIAGWDRAGRLRFVAIQSDEGQVLLARLKPEMRLASWHLYQDGRIWSAGAAFPPLLALLPGGRPLAALTRRAPRTTERAYRFIADRRSFFGRLIRRFAR